MNLGFPKQQLLSPVPALVLFVAFSPMTRAQQQHQAREWSCVRQHFAETPDGDLVVLQCLAAVPKDEKLDAEDEGALNKLEIVRWNAQAFKSASVDEEANKIINGDQSPKRSSVETGKGKEMMDAIRMGFGQKVGQLCQKHPNIVLAPLFPNLTSGTTTLYGCKNIITAPEK